jgi:hypothetical protein
MLRNVALDATQSDYYFAVDCDFIPNQNAFQIVHNLLSSSTSTTTTDGKNNTTPEIIPFKDRLDEGTLFVVPAFEKYQKYHTQDKTVPSSKDELLDLWLPSLSTTSSNNGNKEEKKKEQIVAPFHSVQYPQGHGPTKFTYWSTMSADRNDPPYYDIRYKAGFEPFVIGQKQSAPRYFEDFRGFGFNKIAWLMEARAMGHDFAVLRDVFVIHINHPQHNVNPSKVGAAAMIKFAKYLESSYGHVKELGVKARVKLARQILSGKFRPKGDLSWDGEFSRRTKSSPTRTTIHTKQILSSPSFGAISALTNKLNISQSHFNISALSHGGGSQDAMRDA